MGLLYIRELPSTQLYLVEGLKKGVFSPPVGVWSECQRAGIGTRGNRWEGRCGNLFYSVAVPANWVEQVPPYSLSIYFGWLFVELLWQLGSGVVLKWPNDLYLLGRGKVGGILTTRLREGVVVGIGLNTRWPVPPFPKMDVPVENREIVERFYRQLGPNLPRWEQIFPKYRAHFYRYRALLGVEGELLETGELFHRGEVVKGWR